MRYLKRICLSIIRLKVRTFLLCFIIFVFATAISVVTSIHQSTLDATHSILDRVPIITAVRFDHDAYNAGSFGPAKYLTLDLIEALGDYPEVAYYDYNIVQNFQVRDIKQYTEYEGDDYYVSLTFKGVEYPEVLDFKQGIVNLVNGRTFTQSEIDSSQSVGIISNELAQLNDLTLGDMITIYEETYAYINDTWVVTHLYEQDVEIIGIYENQGFKGVDSEIYNNVYVPNSFVVSVVAQGELSETDTLDRMISVSTPNFVLKSPEAIDEFVSTVQAYLPPYYAVNSTLGLYRQLATPLIQLENASSMSMKVLLLSGSIVLVLSVLLYTRSKRYEIGVYKSMGESNLKVILLQLGELLVISSLTLTLALGTGYIISKTIVEATTKEALSTPNESETVWQDPIGGGNLSIEMDPDVFASSFEMVLSVSYGIKYYGYTLGLMSLASLVSIIYMIRLKPQDLLM